MAVTVEEVAAWGMFKLPDVPADLALLERTLEAAGEQLARLYYITDPMTATQEQAQIMQTARWWARRKTPEGRSAFGGDIAVTITTIDPDVHAMLEPRVGIA